ncbi:hypothetical protein FisN_29Hu010 [Fistulifera solaris]|uniref:Uncharacterized protein n=1 Tax=Fistulifera solaris TaxID=1519565 RepID=A0A1Z5K6L4_FISSO|nr:hypothetical protein FisN_29Hu010 [Fistulifera solaris]|eukprot:GAX21578.1 hypothetical protein FisN_29Hu010 [Fistulifera solaris]
MKLSSPFIISAFLFESGDAIFADQIPLRKLLPCGNRDDGGFVLGCTNYIGLGACWDKDNWRYDFCAGAANAYTLEECQELAESLGVIGLDYFTSEVDGRTLCHLIYDDVVTSDPGFTCPQGLTPDKNLPATGPIAKSNGWTHTKCYHCHY